MRDTVLTNTGRSPVERLEDMLMRRRIAALAGQHRTVQLFTKKITNFRAAFGLPQLNDEPKSTFDSAMSTKPVMQGYDIDWLRGFTTRELSKVIDTLKGKGYAVSRSTVDQVTTYKATRGQNSVEIAILGNSVCCAASVNEKRLSAFDFYPSEEDTVTRGLIPALASSSWDGNIPMDEVQHYCVSWKTVQDAIK